jgi:hypothetical protein
MVDGELTSRVLEYLMLIVDPKTPSPVFYNFVVPRSKNPITNKLIKEGNIF